MVLYSLVVPFSSLTAKGDQTKAFPGVRNYIFVGHSLSCWPPRSWYISFLYFLSIENSAQGFLFQQSVFASLYFNKALLPKFTKENGSIFRNNSTKFIWFIGRHTSGVLTYISSIHERKFKWETFDCNLFSSPWSCGKSSLAYLCSKVVYHSSGIFVRLILSPVYCGAAVLFRVLQADLGSLQAIALVGIIHGAAEVIERSTMVLIDYICHMLWKRRLTPWGNFRTPRRERLMADIVIMSMLYESAAIVSVNGFVYLYQFIYVREETFSNLFHSFAIHTSVSLAIEWVFNSVSLTIETRYQNMAVMAIWRRRWRRHLLVAIANAIAIALFTCGTLLDILHGSSEIFNRPCKVPFA